MKSSLPEWAKKPQPDAVARTWSDTDVVWEDAKGNFIAYQFIDRIEPAPPKPKLWPQVAVGAGLTSLGAAAAVAIQHLV